MAQEYPRPDFQRNPLRWQSLNGPWDFIFDDDDAGLAAKWHQSGLPASVSVSAKEASADTSSSSQAESITQKIASGTQELIKGNILASTTTEHQKRKIEVPFVFQSPASGINERGVHEVLWYERSIEDLRESQSDRLVLRFGAVDYVAKVWVNGQLVGGHRGGHVPFEIDVSDAVAHGQPSRLTVRVYDSAYDLTQPRGKQYWGAKPESIFYTPSGGIWQNVWLEVVPPARIADSSHGTIIRSNDIASGKLHSNIAITGRRAGQKLGVEMAASFHGVEVGKSELVHLARDSDSASVDLSLRLSKEKINLLTAEMQKGLDDPFIWRDGLALWSPEHPHLYDLTLRLVDTSSGNVLDAVETTTGMRSLNWTTGDGTFRLNDRPYFQALCLDQGYWKDTFMTPPSPAALRTDVELGKRMGFNGCRKHQKVEDPLFYYWADKLGYLVWGEMANAYQFSSEYVERYNQEWEEAVKLVINRPCVVTWTPVNESWGYTDLKNDVTQRNHIRQLYYATKTLDPTRSINDNCGWEHVLTDLTTFHDYADGPELEKTCASLKLILGDKAGRDLFTAAVPGDAGCQHVAGAPVMCTEFGGVNIKPQDGEERDWGYTTASDPEDLLQRVRKLVEGVTKGGHCCTFVYTQLADIEQEANGLYSFDREEKLDSSKVRALMEEAIKGYYAKLKV
ncbi:Beta-galactosidase-like protein [Emericellopsis cladophorae]|uniref:Beta-galactosidase-like protein n=1 Tax=Emericellopsis cladophorae TaxID=2686198 RepID=A0A9P9Y164_9HYPO|nr:Beta-galactosidase-like protein [Emericellopsis cladophorae]KAI6781283.1 Beta-galactosidase-like protein [Emericellopsis cladophorae]